jgi:histone acetyltransferase
MEVEADGSQHPAGELPESAKDGPEGEGGQGDEEEDDEDDVPLAKRPELDERERKRRELAKEKAREKEDEVVRRLTKGANANEDDDMMEGEDEGDDVEVWHGVKLVRLF